MFTLEQNLNDLFAPVLQALGLSSAWFFLAVIFCILFIIFLVVTICKSRTIGKMKTHIKNQNEYITGLEASTDLPQIKMPEKGEFSSIVFASDKELKKKKKQQQKKEAENKQAASDQANIGEQVTHNTEQKNDKYKETESISESIDKQVPEINLAKESSQKNSDDVATIVHDAILSALSGYLGTDASSDISEKLSNASDVKAAIAKARKQAANKSSENKDSKDASAAAVTTSVTAAASEVAATTATSAENKASQKESDSESASQDLEVQKILAKILSSNKESSDTAKQDSSALDKSIPSV